MQNRIRAIIFRATFFFLKILGLHKVVYMRNQYYFIDKITINLNDILIEYGPNAYPDIIEKHKKEGTKPYNWRALEKSIRKHGILRRPQVTYLRRVESHANNYEGDCTYRIWDGNHRVLIWSYLHNYNNPKIDVHLLTPYYSLSSVDKEIHKTGFKEYRTYRKKELIKKTYGPDSDRYKQ